MNFDINETMHQMLQVIKNGVTDNWDKLKDGASDILQGHKERLEEFAIDRIRGDIDDDFLKKRLADEEDVLRAEFLSAKIIAESVAQQTINAAMDVLTNAVKAAINTI